MQIFAACWVVSVPSLHPTRFVPSTHTHLSPSLRPGRHHMTLSDLRRCGRRLPPWVETVERCLTCVCCCCSSRCCVRGRILLMDVLCWQRKAPCCVAPARWLTDPPPSLLPSVAIAPCRSDLLCRPLSGVWLRGVAALQRHWLLLPSVSLVCITLGWRLSFYLHNWLLKE